MNDRRETVKDTRGFVLAVCALIGVGGVLALANADEYPLLRISAVAFGLAILMAIVHIGFLWWKDLYDSAAPGQSAGFLSFGVTGKTALIVFITLIAIGLLPVIYHAASA
jgi:hypothetical protein